MGEIYETKQQSREALIQLERAFELDPTFPEVNESITRILSRLGQKEDCLNRLQEVVNRINRSNVFCQWGQTLLQLGRPEAAIGQFLNAVDRRELWDEDDSLLSDLAGALSDRDASIQLDRV